MSDASPPQPAKLVIGIFTKDKELAGPVVRQLIEQFGPVDIAGSWMTFNYTEYYRPEMGAPLFRKMFSFRRLIAQSALPDIKTVTNSIEKQYCVDNKRRVNIDPGYMLPSRFVLATGKDYSHRIYIGKGIYADLTLMYTKGGFKKLPWTYPDYADQSILSYLIMVRKKYLFDYKNKFSGKIK